MATRRQRQNVQILFFRSLILFSLIWFMGLFTIEMLVYWQRNRDIRENIFAIFKNVRRSSSEYLEWENVLTVPPHKVRLDGERECEDCLTERQVDHRPVLAVRANDARESISRRNDAKVLAFRRNDAKELDTRKEGFLGKPVFVNRTLLSGDAQKLFDEGWNNNQFNQYVSDMISLHRELPDVRDPACRDLKYDTSNLPDTSVIICFHDEAWSVLLRTVYSVLERAPAHLIREIILVDDFSDMGHLKGPLEDYVVQLGKVKIVRAVRREGLIRARLLGASHATAKTLTFLDSHCECSNGWLEPLMVRIAESDTNVVCPVIDVIRDDTFEYLNPESSNWDVQVGGFSWNLIFKWKTAVEDRKDRAHALKSPTMAGGLFSISREFFYHLGGYDPGFDIWGGENLEISFKIWMCGGRLEISPCSRIGHVFRKKSPFKNVQGMQYFKRNSVRLAEVWLDDYKEYYYHKINHKLGDYGDVSERKALRKSLQCQSFDWYLKNVYPEVFLPNNSLATGEIRSMSKPMCVDRELDDRGSPVNLWSCHGQGGNQDWYLSVDNEIRRDDHCWDYSAGESIVLYRCHGLKGNQQWEYRQDNSIYHPVSGKCLQLSLLDQKLTVAQCNQSAQQQWNWKRCSVKAI